MKNQNPLVSIIIPVYNMEAYLDNCLNSILEQTYLNWELILIDDGSKDKSKNICENWAKKDKRILFFSQDNHGVSYSRNRGIRESRGKYIIFIDADDIVFNQYIEVLINAFNKYNIDLSIISYFSFQDEKESQYYTLLNKDYEITKNNYNALEGINVITKENICLMYLSDFVTLATNNPKGAYKLVENFDTYDKFSNFLKASGQTFVVSSCEVYKSNKKNIYSIVDGNKIHYRFTENNIMDYTVTMTK